MRRVFLLTYSNTLGTREEIKKMIESNELIITWRYDLPNCFYIVSEESAKRIAESIRKLIPNGYFIVTRADDEYWGWNNQETWYLFDNKKLAPPK